MNYTKVEHPDDVNELRGRIEAYLSRKQYTWTVDDIISEYLKYCNGEYVSFTAKITIELCEGWLQNLTGIGKK